MRNDPPFSWERVQSILEEALELSTDEAARFLDRVCAGDPALRAEVESLIAADRTVPPFLDRRSLLLADLPAVSVPLEGTRLGAYRVLREIGRGGMSIVYLAERADAQFDQRVAIKVLQPEDATAAVAQRLHTERDILASLDHRGIVRILDAGMTDDARPFLVMEHIEGERIDEWCDCRRLTVEQRLDLFGQVLQAVAYAHRALVVHRDLKPDNILVTADGEVRLLDFGIAKLLEADGSPHSPLTRTGVRPMTPEYAAPEQIRGERVTTACDIYALGVLLYQLLTGQRPFDTEGSTPWALERAVLDSEPDLPSAAILRTGGTGRNADRTAGNIADARRTEPIRLRTALAGDLDAIVLKALRKEPGERYGSADAFREDLERYRDSRPVMARRGTRSYLVRKFVRRHRAGVALSAAAALLMLGSTAAIAASRADAERARARAETEARTAGEVTEFLVGVFSGSNPFGPLGDTVSARTLLYQGRERVDRELINQPVVRASLLHAIGRVYTGLGHFDAADSLLTQAALLRADQLGPEHRFVAETYRALGSNLSQRRDFRGALPHLERAYAIEQRLAGGESSGRAQLLVDLAEPLRELGHADSAHALVQRALALDRTHGDTASIDHLQRRVALAAALRALEDYDEASRIYADVLPRLARAAGERHPAYANAVNNAAFLLTRQERWAEAVPLYRQALEIARAALGGDHLRVVIFEGNLASALAFSGDTDMALGVLRDRQVAIQRMWPDGHWRVGSAAQGIGKLLLMMERHADAEVSFREAVASYHATLGPGHTWSAVAETWVVVAMTIRGDPRGPALLDRAITRLSTAELDRDNRDDIARIADRLAGIGMTQQAQAFRSILEAQG